MSTVKKAVKRIVPFPVRKVLRNTSWLLNPMRVQNARRLERFADKHKNQRCFIIGNGPSLNETDLSLLRGEITFGLNRIYLKFDELGFATNYYVVVNELVIEQCAEEIAKIPSPKFVSWYAKRWLRPADDIVYVREPQGARLDFSIRPALALWVGATVTYVAMQLAYYMGFEEVILIGVDHNFQTKGAPHETVVLEGEDPNHFDPNYFGPGFRWQLPDLEASERAYRLAKEFFEGDGRRILDATVGGKLQVFPKVDYDSLFIKSGRMKRSSKIQEKA